MKILEKTQGKEAVEKFIQSLPDKNGFGFSEGFTIDLVAKDTGNEIIMKYKDNKWELTPKLIDEIIGEREEFDEEVKRATKT